jgi:hypothetical protein
MAPRGRSPERAGHVRPARPSSCQEGLQSGRLPPSAALTAISGRRKRRRRNVQGRGLIIYRGRVPEPGLSTSGWKSRRRLAPNRTRKQRSSARVGNPMATRLDVSFVKAYGSRRIMKVTCGDCGDCDGLDAGSRPTPAACGRVVSRTAAVWSGGGSPALRRAGVAQSPVRIATHIPATTEPS